MGSGSVLAIHPQRCKFETVQFGGSKGKYLLFSSLKLKAVTLDSVGTNPSENQFRLLQKMQLFREKHVERVF